MDKFVETSTLDRYIDLDEKNNDDRRNKLFEAVHNRSDDWNKFKLFL